MTKIWAAREYLISPCENWGNSKKWLVIPICEKNLNMTGISRKEIHNNGKICVNCCSFSKVLLELNSGICAFALKEGLLPSF